MTSGLLLERGTGRPLRHVRAPMRSRVREWDREQALEDTAKLLEDARRVPEIVGTTTTNRYLCYPAAASGISRASSGSTAWSFSAYTELVPVSTITATFYVVGLIWEWHTPLAAVDTTYEVLIELATGSAASEVLICQFPGMRSDTAVGHIPSHCVILPEPKEVAANTRLSVRVAQSLATTSQTYSGIKLLYQTA